MTTQEHKSSNQLIEENQKLVHSLALKIHRRLPPHLPLDDIVCYGQLGLTQAARSYQANEFSSFATFAYYRIRGAIYDGLTRMNWTSRAAYQRIKAEQAANEVLQDAGDSNADGQSNDPESQARWLAETSERLAVVYLTTVTDEGQSQLAIADESAEAPDDIAEANELHGVLRDAIDELPEPAKSLITMTYFEGFSLAESAEKLGKSRSWACRLHAKILSQLAHSLGTDSPA